MKYVKVDPPGWLDRKNIAANTAAESIISILPESKLKNGYSSSDSDDSSDPSFDNEYSADTIRKFADALKSNFLVDSSFHCVTESKFCFCPCSSKLHKWRDIFGVTGLSDSDKCEKKSPMKRQGIIAHLETVGKNPKAVLHRLVYKYLRNLWYDSDGNLYKFLDYEKKSVRAGTK